MLALPVAPIVWALRAFITGGVPKHARFYYVKPTMALYWAAVNNITTLMAMNMGLLPDKMIDESEDNKLLGEDGVSKLENVGKLTQSEIDAFHRILPNMFRSNGNIDVRALSTRAEKLAIAQRIAVKNKLEEAKDAAGAAAALAAALNANACRSYGVQAVRDMDTYMTDYQKSSAASPDKGAVADFNAENTDPDSFWGKVKEIVSPLGYWIKDIGSDLKAEMLDASGWITFRVTGERTFTESFTSSVGESSLGAQLNSMSQNAREMKFNMGGGNIGDGVLANTVEALGSFTKAAASKFADQIGLGGMGALIGGAMLDMPKVWQDSDAQLSKIEYTFQLRATYGNKMSIFTDIYVPLAMIMAAGLPMATGRSSYTAPFLVEVYRQGGHQCRMGVVESINITRGVGNNGWSDDGMATAIDVTMTIVDLSSKIYMPVERTAFYKGWFDDHSAYTDYIATLSGLGLTDMTSFGRKWRRNFVHKFTNFQQMWSTENLAATVSNSLIGRRFKAVTIGVNSLLGGSTTDRN